MNDEALEKIGHTEVFDKLPGLMERMCIPVRGVLHIGANMASEVPIYRRMGCDPIELVEANSAFSAHLKSIPGVTHYSLAVSRTGPWVDFHITEDPQASSVLPPLQHKVARVERIAACPLCSLETPLVNLLVLDVQGSELDVLESGVLEDIDLIVCETSFEPRYLGGATEAAVAMFMMAHNFTQLDYFPHGDAGFGDAVYVKRKFVSTRTIILAAGEASRFDGQGHKQHLEVRGERLIDRLCRQFGKLGGVAIATHHTDLAPKGIRVFVPAVHDATVATMVSTSELWRPKTFIVPGDVYFTDKAFDALSHATGPKFVSDGQDIFALILEQLESNQEFTRAIRDALKAKAFNRGRLWEIYRALYGIGRFPLGAEDNTFEQILFISDETQDFDTTDEYVAFLRGQSKNLCHRSTLPNASELRRLLAERMFKDSDIAEHLGTLFALASMCQTCVEFGVRSGNSTIALLAGLEGSKGTLHSFDLKPHTLPVEVWRRGGFCFRQADTATLERIPACDLLFIDTLHTEHHVELELRHACAVRRWIVLHDTTLFWEGGERGEPGLREAIVRFLDRNPEWKWRHRYMHNNGLLILERSP